jgi:hypothetical protein
VPLKRMKQGKSARQVVVIEVGAIDAFCHDALSVRSRNASGERGGIVAKASQRCIPIAAEAKSQCDPFYDLSY